MGGYGEREEMDEGDGGSVGEEVWGGVGCGMGEGGERGGRGEGVGEVVGEGDGVVEE